MCKRERERKRKREREGETGMKNGNEKETMVIRGPTHLNIWRMLQVPFFLHYLSFSIFCFLPCYCSLPFFLFLVSSHSQLFKAFIQIQGTSTTYTHETIKTLHNILQYNVQSPQQQDLTGSL